MFKCVSVQRKIQEHISQTANTDNIEALRLLKYYLCNTWPIIIMKPYNDKILNKIKKSVCDCVRVNMLMCVYIHTCLSIYMSVGAREYNGGGSLQ